MDSAKLTPKKVSKAIGVSESSVKRWCDRGLIEFTTTAGGHRRISRESVIRLLRQKKHALVNSELIGLPPNIRPQDNNQETVKDHFLNAIVDGNEERGRQLLYQLFISGCTIAEIGDSVISSSFQEIGLRWECGDLEVYRERRACEITLRLLGELNQLLPIAAAEAPLAIGGSPGSAGYALPSLLAEMVFREAGWRAQSLGSMLPFPTLAIAAQDQKPRAFWLSVSAIEDEQQFLTDFDQFRQSIPADTVLVVGGKALDAPVRQRMQFSAFGDNLKQLESLASTLRAAPASLIATGAITNY